ARRPFAFDQQLVGLVLALVVHGGATLDPVTEVVPVDLLLPAQLDLFQHAVDAQAAAVLVGVEEVVHAADAALAYVADADRQQLVARVAVLDLHGRHAARIQELPHALQVFALRAFPVLGAQVALVHVVLLGRELGLVHQHAHVLVTAQRAALAAAGLEALDRDADRHAL